MHSVLMWVARVAGVMGVMLIGAAGAARLSGAFWLGGLQLGTLLQAGMAATLVACLCYLATLAERRPG